MSILLNLTGQVDNDTVDTLSDVSEVATHLKIPCIIVGATARDLILHYGYGAAVQRATSDIDFAIQVESWASFEALKQALCARNFTETPTQHRLANSTGKPIDIVPFGKQVQNNSTIAWPPNGDVVMNVMGFQEACDHAQSVVIREAPYLACPVVTPEGFAILKLIAWQDRDRPNRLKDASDIGYLFSVFRRLDSFIEELYSDNNIADLERYQWDTDLAACFLLGKNCKTIASDQTVAEILKLTHNPDNRNISRLAEEMEPGKAGDNLKYLEVFMSGLAS